MGITSDVLLTAAAPVGGPYPASFYVCSQGILGRFARQLDTTLDDGNTQTGALRVIADNAVNVVEATNVTAAMDAQLFTVCVAY